MPTLNFQSEKTMRDDFWDSTIYVIAALSYGTHVTDHATIHGIDKSQKLRSEIMRLEFFRPTFWSKSPTETASDFRGVICTDYVFVDFAENPGFFGTRNSQYASLNLIRIWYVYFVMSPALADKHTEPTNLSDVICLLLGILVGLFLLLSLLVNYCYSAIWSKRTMV